MLTQPPNALCRATRAVSSHTRCASSGNGSHARMRVRPWLALLDSQSTGLVLPNCTTGRPCARNTGLLCSSVTPGRRRAGSLMRTGARSRSPPLHSAPGMLTQPAGPLTQLAACSHSRPTRCVEPRALCRATRAPPDRGSRCAGKLLPVRMVPTWSPGGLFWRIAAMPTAAAGSMPGLPAFEHRGGSGGAHPDDAGRGRRHQHTEGYFGIPGRCNGLPARSAPRSPALGSALRTPATEWPGRSRTARGTAVGSAARPPARKEPAAPGG